MENQTFNYKDDRYSIRPQAPPGGESHFNISDSGYGDKDIYHPHKRNNHPRNDINPPPNFIKREEVIESTPNGARPVTGNRPSIKLRAPPGGFSSFDNYSEDSKTENPTPQEGNVCQEPQKLNPELQESKQEQNPFTKHNNNTKQNNQSTFQSSFFNSNENDNKDTYRPVYTPQAPPGGKSSISFGYDDEPVNKPKQNSKPNPEFNQSRNNNNDTYRPYYAPQAPPGGKSSISFGYDDEPVNNTPKPKPKPNPEFQESFFNSKEPDTPVKRNNHTKQNNESTFGSSLFSSNEDNNTPYKPYYAPQAPPGGKDSISLGFSESSSSSSYSSTGRRRNYENDHFKSSLDNKEKDDGTYKPYYAPQAPPGGKDSISLGFSDSNENNNNNTQTFSGRRRNYNADHFKSSIGFNY